MTDFGRRQQLPEYLREWQVKIEAHARASGLDIFPQVFEILTFDEMNEVAAYGGFPTRFPHWRWGMEYERLKKSGDYGLSRIYEMVINNNPCVAYLLEGNSLVDQKLVMAHVCGHNDFFKNNFAFKITDQDRRPPKEPEDLVVSGMNRLPLRKWIDTFANHSARIRKHMERHGVGPVEEFIDVCLSIENLIDPPGRMLEGRHKPEKPEDPEPIEVPRIQAKNYMDSFINPEEYMVAQKKKLEALAETAKGRFPEKPDRDVLRFLLENSPLEHWEQDVLDVVREEAYYFWPQAQTKVMNEGWACISSNSLVFSRYGAISMRDLVEGAGGLVSDGKTPRRVLDRHVIRDHETVTVRTRRGLKLTGSNNHRVMGADGVTWRRLDELALGDRVQISGAAGLWPEELCTLDYQVSGDPTLAEVAEDAGVCVDTVLRHRAGMTVERAQAVAFALIPYEPIGSTRPARRMRQRKPVTLPTTVDTRLGAFLGYLAGDGHISRVKRVFGLTTGDHEQAVTFADLGQQLFGLLSRMKLDDNRWRVLMHSETVADFLIEGLGLTHGPSAREKKVPDAVMRSPAAVVRAFLQALFDCDGYAGNQGVILSTTSDTMSEQVQLLLMNFGVLSRRRAHKDGCWHVHVTGSSVERFAATVNFGLTRKKARLERYLIEHKGFKEERWDDEVVSLERGREDVYDITVEETHRYAAAGFINHNSYWHSKIMTGYALDSSEVVDYADRNASVMGGGGGKLNPYKLGVELYRFIEERWNKGQFGKEWEDCDTLEARRDWDRKTGLGRKKIFEVRALHTDVTFIDEFLTPEFCVYSKMFTFAWSNRNDRFEIDTREFKTVKEKLLFQLTNFGHPFISVTDANLDNRGELLLRHDHHGVDLDAEKARDTLRALQRVWRRPVAIHTTLENRPTLLRFDGKEQSSKAIK